MSSNESFTLIVVPDRHAEVKRYHLRKIWILQALAAVAVVILIGLVMAGHYVSVGGEAEITVSVIDRTRIRVDGLATWHGTGDMVNTGDLNGEATINGGVAHYSNGDCAAELTFGPARLTVEDNLKCGGLNVSFTGAYALERTRPATP